MASTTGNAASKKRPRDDNDPNEESPEKKAKAIGADQNQDLSLPSNGSKPDARTAVIKSTPVMGSSTKKSVHLADSADLNTIGSPPVMISSAPKLELAVSTSTDDQKPTGQSGNPLSNPDREEKLLEDQNTTTGQTTTTAPQKKTSSFSTTTTSWITCLFLIMVLFLFGTTTVSIGFWHAEKLNRELDATGHQTSLKMIGSKLKTLQIDHANEIETWKAKVGLLEQELKRFQDKCSSMVEQLERNLVNQDSS